MHCEPNSFAPSSIIQGLRTAIESTLIFSAPDFSTLYISFTSLIPPPTVYGTKTTSPTLSTNFKSMGLFSALAVTS